LQQVKSRNKSRTVGIIVSIVLVLAILLTGTLAFVLPFQHDSNEFELGGIMFEATLNEDFNFDRVTGWRVTDPPVRKQINVTNTGHNNIEYGSVFVRLQLREFMEIYNTTYYYWAPNGTTMVPRSAMDTAPGQAALFMTDSNNLSGNPSRVFVVAPSTWDDVNEVYVHLSEADARAYIFDNYEHLFPGSDDTLPGRTLVLTTDFISGVTGWFVISAQGDLHGQYGRYMVANIDRDTDTPQIVGTQTVPRATNVDYGLHEPNGECLYDINL